MSGGEAPRRASMAPPPVKMLDDDNRDKVLKQWSGVADMDAAGIPNKCVHELFMEAAKTVPDKVAVEFEDDPAQTLTYKELDMISNRVANHLRKLGAKPDDLIGVCIGRSSIMLAAMLGIMKSGAAYVALDPKFPVDRLAYIVEEASIRHVLVDETLASFVDDFTALLARSESKTEVHEEITDTFVKRTTVTTTVAYEYRINKIIANDFASKEYNPETDEYTPSDVNSYNLAYAIYTSGSTGKPKGVLLPHRGVVNFLLRMQECPGIKPEDRLLAVTTICFDISVLELFGPVITGATVIIVGAAKSRDGPELINLLQTKNVQIMQATPATWGILVETGWQGQKDIRILCGGEPLPISLANKLTPIVGQLWNMYGPTEVTVWCTVKLVEGQITTPPTIGRPIKNTTAYILDVDTLKPVAPGEQGKLFLGGEQCARGYNKRPEITAEKFIPDPFRTDVENPIMYDSGDLARFNEEGDIVCCGRADYQVKINGFRIELGEIETALDKHAALKANVVIAADVAGQKQLVAYVVAKPEFVRSLNIEELQKHVERLCTPYMVPGIFIQLDALPLLPNGKVNRHALPAPTTVRKQMSEQAVEEPSNDYERKLVQWSHELLGVSPISVSVNLFTIGGNSLFAVKLHNKIQAEFKVEVPVATILQSQNIKTIASELRALANPEEAGDDVDQEKKIIVKLSEGSDRDPFFLFHPAGGFLFPYFALIKDLRTDQPVYGVLDPAIGQKTPELFDTLEAMGDRYYDQLVKSCPAGPYYLGGWSLGGFLALHVAKRLSDEGKEVALVVIIDQIPEEAKTNRATFWYDNITKGRHMVKQAVALKHEKLKAEGDKVSVRRGFFSIVSKAIGAKDALKDSDGPVAADFAKDPSSSTMLTLLDHHMKLTSEFRPPSYGGRVLIMKAMDNDAEWTSQFNNWLRLLPNAVIRDLPGTHYKIIKEPYVKAVAEQITAAVQFARFQATNIPREGGEGEGTVLQYGEFDDYTDSSIVYQMGVAAAVHKKPSMDVSGSFKKLTEFPSLARLSTPPSLTSQISQKFAAPDAQFESFTITAKGSHESTEHVIAQHDEASLIAMRAKAKTRKVKHMMQTQIDIIRGQLVFCNFQMHTTTGVQGLKLVIDVFTASGLFQMHIRTQEIYFGDVPAGDDVQNLRFSVFQTEAGEVAKIPAGKYEMRATIVDEVGHVLFRIGGPFRMLNAAETSQA